MPKWQYLVWLWDSGFRLPPPFECRPQWEPRPLHDGDQEPNPPQCDAVAASLQGFPVSHVLLCDCLDFGTSGSLWYSSPGQITWNFAVFLHPPWEEYEQMTAIGLERPALVSSPFYLIHFVPFQLYKKIGWIGHGLSSPTKTIRTRKLKHKTADRYAGCMDQSENSMWMVQTVFTDILNLLWLHIWVQIVTELFHTYWACFGCLLKVSERSKLWSLLICFRSIVKRKQFWKTWWHSSNKVRSKDWLAFPSLIGKMSAALVSETPGDQGN